MDKGRSYELVRPAQYSPSAATGGTSILFNKTTGPDTVITNGSFGTSSPALAIKTNSVLRIQAAGTWLGGLEAFAETLAVYLIIDNATYGADAVSVRGSAGVLYWKFDATVSPGTVSGRLISYNYSDVLIAGTYLPVSSSYGLDTGIQTYSKQGNAFITNITNGTATAQIAVDNGFTRTLTLTQFIITQQT